jgi:hypothetical protein
MRCWLIAAPAKDLQRHETQLQQQADKKQVHEIVVSKAAVSWHTLNAFYCSRC